MSRLSPSPAKYLNHAERLFARWGPSAFALAKFIPGMPMAGPVLAGGLGTTLRVFLIFDLLAMGLWVGVFTGLGMLFQRDVDRALRGLDRLGGWGLLVGTVIVALAMEWSFYFAARAHFTLDEYKRYRSISASYWGGWFGIGASAPVFFFIAAGGLGRLG